MKSKIIAICILVFVMLVPFRMAFLSDEIASSIKFVFSFLGTIIGFLVAFGIGTNEPFDRKETGSESSASEEKEQSRRAA